MIEVELLRSLCAKYVDIRLLSQQLPGLVDKAVMRYSIRIYVNQVVVWSSVDNTNQSLPSQSQEISFQVFASNLSDNRPFCDFTEAAAKSAELIPLLLLPLHTTATVQLLVKIELGSP